MPSITQNPEKTIDTNSGLSAMPTAIRDYLAKQTLRCATEFYSNPENVIKYNAWRAERRQRA